MNLQVLRSLRSYSLNGTQVSNVNFNVKTLQGIPSGGNAAETIFPNGMCGIGGIRDEIDFEAGKAIKRFGMVDIGSLTYTTDSYGFYTQQITDSKPYSSATPISNLHILVNGYTKINLFSATVADKSVTLNSSYHAVNKLYLKNTAYSTIADFKAAMSGVMLVYELAEPIEYTITADVPTYNTVKGGCEKIIPYDDDDALTAPATMLVHYEYKAGGNLENYVQKSATSGLLKNDGTVDTNTYLTASQFKTINGESIVGSGNITIQGGGSGEANVIEVIKVNGTALTPDANKAVNITVPAAITESTVSGWGFTKNTGTVSSLSDLGITATATELNYVDGVTSNIQTQLNAKGTYSKPSGGIPKTDLASAVQTSLGKADTALQSAPVTSVNGQTGEVNLTIPSAVTESTVSGWGFTKNTGTYSKPSGGIPKTDLASAVQTSLGKADTALQSESDPVFTASAAHGITTNNISSWNGAVSTIAGYGDIVSHNASEFQTKITVSSSQPSGGSNGDIWIVV